MTLTKRQRTNGETLWEDKNGVGGGHSGVETRSGGTWLPALGCSSGNGTTIPYLLGGWLECLLRTQAAWNNKLAGFGLEDVCPYLGDK